MVARSEIACGAALFANAISASRAIMYSLSGGYFASCAFVVVAPKPASSKHNTYRYLFISTWILLLKLLGFLNTLSITIQPPPRAVADLLLGLRKPAVRNQDLAVANLDGRSRHPARLIGSHEDRHVCHLLKRHDPSRVGHAGEVPLELFPGHAYARCLELEDFLHHACLRHAVWSQTDHADALRCELGG